MISYYFLLDDKILEFLFIYFINFYNIYLLSPLKMKSVLVILALAVGVTA